MFKANPLDILNRIFRSLFGDGRGVEGISSVEGGGGGTTGSGGSSGDGGVSGAGSTGSNSGSAGSTGSSGAKRIYSDTELKTLEQNDAYSRRKLFLDYVIFMLLMFLTCMVILFAVQLVVNEAFRVRITEEISKNLLPIILYAIGVLGIKNMSGGGSGG